MSFEKAAFRNTSTSSIISAIGISNDSLVSIEL